MKGPLTQTLSPRERAYQEKWVVRGIPFTLTAIADAAHNSQSRGGGARPLPTHLFFVSPLPWGEGLGEGALLHALSASNIPAASGLSRQGVEPQRAGRAIRASRTSAGSARSRAGTASAIRWRSPSACRAGASCR